MYVPGEEIITYERKEELTGLISSLLSDNDRRKKVAKAGQLRTLLDHTYEKRLELLIHTVFGDGKGYPSKLLS